MKIIVVGGIAAGTSIAAKANRSIEGADIVLYEKTDVVSFGACGLPYYIGNDFSNEDQMIERSAEEFRETGINVQINHEVIGIDFDKKQVTVKDLKTGESFEDNYDKLVLTMGSTPIIPPIKNHEKENVFTLKTLDDGNNIKAKLEDSNIKDIVIVGAGYIGLELASTMNKEGKNIRVIQLDDDIMPEAFDEDMTAMMKDELADNGVDLHLSEYVTEIVGEDRVEKVMTNKGEYDADMVVISTGVRPNTEFIKDSDLEFIGNGAIKVDKYGETNIKDVYSAGDCTAVENFITKEHVYMALATTANKLGRIIGDNLNRNEYEYPGTIGTAGLELFNLECARTGLTEKEAKEKNLPYKAILIKDKNQTDYCPGQKDIYVKLIYNIEDKKILGAQIIGEKGAALRINTIAAAIFGGLRTDELGMLDLLYAPPFARTWDVLNIAGNVAK